MKNLIRALFLILLLGACQSKPATPDHFKEVVSQLQRDMVDKHLHHNLTQLFLQNKPVGEGLLLRTMEKTRVALADLPGPSPLLIFRYSEIHCNTCIDLVVQKMNDLYLAGFTQMAIIASYTEYRHFSSFARANRLQMPVYLLGQEAAAGIFDVEIPPYLFVLDESMRIRYPFVPIKEIEAGIDMYLNFAREKLEENAAT